MKWMKWCCREGETNGIVNNNNREVAMIIFKRGWGALSWEVHPEMAIDFFYRASRDLKSMNRCWNSTKSSVNVISLECFELQSLYTQECELANLGVRKNEAMVPGLLNNFVTMRHLWGIIIFWEDLFYDWDTENTSDSLNSLTIKWKQKSSYY